MKTKPQSQIDTLRGTNALVTQAVQSVTTLVEQIHGAITHLAPPLTTQDAVPQKTRGIARFVYGSVRGITGVVSWGTNRGLDVAQIPAVSKALTPAFKKLAALLKVKAADAYRETVLAAVNGVLGDTLDASNNPLAIPMQFRQLGEPLARQQNNGKVLILVHGLCMNDVQWQRDGHDHGAMLAQARGYEPLYLHYNTGRRIDQNGADFAQLIEQTLQNWPVPVTQLVIIGHSMGGLVARSACHHASQNGQVWVKTLSKLITLGTPHAGAPLERAGAGVDYVLGMSPYTAPLARIGLVRSAGIQDLRSGAVTARGETPNLPKHVRLYALACTKQKQPKLTAAKVNVDLAEPFKRLLGDGLVPVKSALAQVDHPALGLPLKVPATRQAVVYQTDHFQMLGSQEVAKHLLRWLPN